MTEPIPLWVDWRLLSVIAAFLGFTFGTWIKHAFDLRLDRIRRDKENRVFAIAFRAELGTLLSDAGARLNYIEVVREARAENLVIARLNIPAKAVYANNTHRLGDFGDRVAGLVVQAHGHADHIRQVIAAYPSGTALAPDFLAAVHRSFLHLLERAAEAHNALDVFLGDPERYPDPNALAAEADPAGDLQILAK